MKISATMDPERPKEYLWKAIDEDTYDGAEDSPTRHQIGWGRDMETAKAELRKQLEAA